jgi:hypothetical protein
MFAELTGAAGCYGESCLIGNRGILEGVLGSVLN